MLVTNHVLCGALIGSLARRRPVTAFALGVASHYVLDAVPHWGEWPSERYFMKVAVRDGLTGLAVIGALSAAAPPPARLAVLAGMAGAALPDLDKPGRHFLGRSPFPRVIDWFHGAIQRESGDRWWVEVAAGTAFGAAAGVVIGKLRQR